MWAIPCSLNLVLSHKQSQVLGYHRVGDVHQWIQVFNHQILGTKAIWGLFNHSQQRGRWPSTYSQWFLCFWVSWSLRTSEYLGFNKISYKAWARSSSHHPSTVPPTSSWGCFHPTVGFIQSLPLKLKYWIKHRWLFGSRYLLVSLPPAGAWFFFVDTKDKLLCPPQWERDSLFSSYPQLSNCQTAIDAPRHYE